MQIQFYVIHNLDENRRNHMLQSFEQSKIDSTKVKWVLRPNKNDISDEFAKSLLIPGISYTCGVKVDAQKNWGKALICCTYKHYLALKDMIENDHQYAVIMEDNMQLGQNVPERLQLYIKQLDEMYPDWDILFDNDGINIPYTESEIKEGIYVYPKTNEITVPEPGRYVHGGTKAACFYLLNLKCAKKLYANYLPFNNSPDWWMNDLFRKLYIKSFWAVPGNIFEWKHISTIPKLNLE